MMVMPGLITWLLMPRRINWPGAPPAKPQLVTLPSSPLTSTKNQTCGFCHSTLVTTPRHFDRFRVVELGGEGMVREQRAGGCNRQQQESEGKAFLMFSTSG